MAKGNKPEKKTAQSTKEAPKVEMKEKDKTKQESNKKGDGVKAMGADKASKQTEAAAKRAEAERREKEAAEAAAAKSAQAKRKRDSSDEESSSSSDESSSSSSSSSASSSSSESSAAAAPPPAKKAAAATKGADSKPAAKPVAAAAKPATPAAKAQPAKKAAEESSSSESSSSSSSEDEKDNKDQSSSSSSSSSEESSSSSSASEPVAKKGGAKPAAAATPAAKSDAAAAKPKPAAAAGGAKPANADGNAAGVKRLFLGNCSYDINDDLLKEALGKYGTIESIHWVTDRETGKFYGTGFVEFATADEANAALAADGVEIAGRAVRIQIAKPRANEGKAGAGGARGAGGAGGGGGKPRGKQPLSEKPAGCKTMFVGGLPQTVSEDEIRKLFGECGEITGIRWVERDGEFKGCGFIEFADTSAVDKAAEKNGVMVGNRSIRVDYAAAKEKKQF